MTKPERQPKAPTSPMPEQPWDSSDAELLAVAEAFPGLVSEREELRAWVSLRGRELVESGAATVALEVRCISKTDGKQCRKEMATIWNMEGDLHYIRWSKRTDPTWREVLLLRAMALREGGLSEEAEAGAAAADQDAVPQDGCLQMPVLDSGKYAGMYILSCPVHGMLMFSMGTLWREATSTRAVLRVDVQKHRAGYSQA